jgi:hypothetical protein
MLLVTPASPYQNGVWIIWITGSLLMRGVCSVCHYAICKPVCAQRLVGIRHTFNMPEVGEIRKNNGCMPASQHLFQVVDGGISGMYHVPHYWGTGCTYKQQWIRTWLAGGRDLNLYNL